MTKGKDLKQIDNMKKEDKLALRAVIHSQITDKILEELESQDISKNSKIVKFSLPKKSAGYSTFTIPLP